jgi:hypothetical protein
MISRALEAEIVRLHYTEHWPVGTIAVREVDDRPLPEWTGAGGTHAVGLAAVLWIGSNQLFACGLSFPNNLLDQGDQAIQQRVQPSVLLYVGQINRQHQRHSSAKR